MISLFKDRSPAAIFWLIILSIIVHSHFFVDAPVVLVAGANGMLSTFLNNYIAPLFSGIVVLIYHAFVILQALSLNHLLTNNRMYSRVNYFPAMVYILLTGLFTEWSRLTPALIANTILIWFFAKLIQLYGARNPKTFLFNIGLLTSVSVILYHPMTLLVPVAFFALMLLRPFIITEWLVLVMGIIFPFYLLTSYLYSNDRLQSVKNYLPVWNLNLPDIQNKIVFFITIAFIIITLLTGLLYWQQENRRLLIQVRKYWVVLLSMLFVLLSAPFIDKSDGIGSLILCIVPASPIIAKGFLAPKKLAIPTLMFWALISLAILKNWQVI